MEKGGEVNKDVQFTPQLGMEFLNVNQQRKKEKVQAWLQHTTNTHKLGPKGNYVSCNMSSANQRQAYSQELLSLPFRCLGSILREI